MKLGETGEISTISRGRKARSGTFWGAVNLSYTAILLFCSQFEIIWWTPSLGVSYLGSGADNINGCEVRAQNYFPTTLSTSSKSHREVDLRHT